jgi:hypothetical protein
MKRSTRAAVMALQCSETPHLTLVQMAERLKLKPSAAGLLSDVMRNKADHVSVKAEARLREALALPTERDARVSVHLQPATHARLAASKALAHDLSFDEVVNRLLDLEALFNDAP